MVPQHPLSHTHSIVTSTFANPPIAPASNVISYIHIDCNLCLYCCPAPQHNTPYPLHLSTTSAGYPTHERRRPCQSCLQQLRLSPRKSSQSLSSQNSQLHPLENVAEGRPQPELQMIASHARNDRPNVIDGDHIAHPVWNSVMIARAIRRL